MEGSPSASELNDRAGEKFTETSLQNALMIMHRYIIKIHWRSHMVEKHPSHISRFKSPPQDIILASLLKVVLLYLPSHFPLWRPSIIPYFDKPVCIISHKTNM